MGFLDKILGKKDNDDKKISNVSLTHIFISYGSRDTDIAENMYNFLESNKVKCWMAPRDIEDGSNYAEEINSAIKKANILIFIFSRDASQSRYILNELEIAFSRGIPIIAYKVDESYSIDDYGFYLRDARWVDASADNSNHYKKLMEALREEYNSLGFPRVIDMSIFKENRLPKDNNIEKSVSLKKPFKAYEGDKPYIFISYAHKDAELVFKEIKKFHDKGFPIWYDQGLTAGLEWDEEIEDALLNASLLVVFITKISMSRSNVVDEIKLALEKNIDIVPIYLEEAELARGLNLRLSQKHAIFKYTSYEEDYLEDCFKAFKKAGISSDDNMS